MRENYIILWWYSSVTSIDIRVDQYELSVDLSSVYIDLSDSNVNVKTSFSLDVVKWLNYFLFGEKLQSTNE